MAPGHVGWPLQVLLPPASFLIQFQRFSGDAAANAPAEDETRPSDDLFCFSVALFAEPSNWLRLQLHSLHEPDSGMTLGWGSQLRSRQIVHIDEFPIYGQDVLHVAFVESAVPRPRMIEPTESVLCHSPLPARRMICNQCRRKIMACIKHEARP